MHGLWRLSGQQGHEVEAEHILWLPALPNGL
jgi:hypothetical protein